MMSEHGEAIKAAFPEIQRFDEFGRISQHSMALSVEHAGQRDFLMSFDELVDTMSHMSIGFVRPNDPKEWHIDTIVGGWKGAVGPGRVTAGGAPHPGITLTNWCKNPRFHIRIPEVEVSATELERRKRSAVAPKIPPANVVVTLRQSQKAYWQTPLSECDFLTRESCDQGQNSKHSASSGSTTSHPWDCCSKPLTTGKGSYRA